MGQKIYWHNITQNKFNDNDFGDAVENAEKGDIIMFSERGNALVLDLKTLSDGEEFYPEHEDTRKQFLEYFKEFNGEDF